MKCLLIKKYHIMQTIIYTAPSERFFRSIVRLFEICLRKKKSNTVLKYSCSFDPFEKFSFHITNLSKQNSCYFFRFFLFFLFFLFLTVSFMFVWIGFAYTRNYYFTLASSHNWYFTGLMDKKVLYGLAEL